MLSIRTQIGDQRSVAANGRDHRSAELERELAGEDTDLALTDDATLEQLEVTLDRLRQLQHRFDHGELEPDDWALIRAVLVKELT